MDIISIDIYQLKINENTKSTRINDIVQFLCGVI